MGFPVVKSVSYVLAHTPGLVRYGSKPMREIPKEPELLGKIMSKLRSFDQAVVYPPHQVFIGNIEPSALWKVARPWFGHLVEDGPRYGKFGEIMPEDEFYGLMKIVDEFELVLLGAEFTRRVTTALQKHPLLSKGDVNRLGEGASDAKVAGEIAAGALPLYTGDGGLAGCLRRGHEEDENLSAEILLENLACKASGVLALRHVLKALDRGPDTIEYVLGCGEEGVGDRYQRGAGNLAKAIAEHAGCQNASGADIKAFCCSPVHSLVIAAGLVYAGVFNEVAVVGGGALAKLGMKMRGHLARGMPIMEDVLGALAVVVGRDDGYNPQIRLDHIGKHDVVSGSSQQAIMESLVLRPLDELGWSIADINVYASEMHNPEITEPAGSGNTPRTNYRMIGGLAVMRKQLDPGLLDRFENTYGMPGYSPTQGHIAAAVPFLGHAREKILRREIENSMFIAKGSLFLAKMTKLSDGMSFILVKNEGRKNNG